MVLRAIKQFQHIGLASTYRLTQRYIKTYKHTAIEVYKHIVGKTEPFHIGTQRSRLLCELNALRATDQRNTNMQQPRLRCINTQ